MKDISIGSTLLNEQELNETDNNYMASNDNGYFITQMDYKYDGFVSEVSKENKISLGLNAVSLILGTLSFVPGPVGDFAGVLGYFLSVGQTTESMRVVSNNGDPTTGVSVSNGAITAINKFTTKEGQINNYINADTGKPSLIKNATYIVEGDDKHGNAWFRNGDHVTAYFRVAHTEDWHTRLEREISLSIVDSQGNSYFKDENGKNIPFNSEFIINEPVYKRINLDDETGLKLLADGDNYFKFIPRHTSDYKFVAEQNDSIDISIKKESQNTYNPVNNNSYRMNANEVYYIKIHSGIKSISNLTMSPSLTIPNIGVNAEYMIKYVPNETGAFTISTLNSFNIESLYMKTETNDYADIPRVDRQITKSKNVEAVLIKDKVYYFVLRNPNAQSASDTVQVTACTNVLKDSKNNGRTFTGGENFRYYKYVNTGNKPGLNISFEGIDNTVNAADFCVFNQNGAQISPRISYYDGYLGLGYLPKGTYYIGVRTLYTVLLKPTVEVSSVTAGVWKEYKNEQWIELGNDITKEYARGCTYKFGYWLGTTLIMDYRIEGTASKDYINFSSVYDGLNIGKNRRDGTNFTLKAVQRSNNPKYNGLEYPEWLTIIPVFSESEIVTPTFDYVNQIRIMMSLPSDVNSLTYKIMSNSSTGTTMQDTNEYIVRKGQTINEDFLKLLCGRKSTTAKFVICKINIPYGDDTSGNRDVILNKEYDINCLYSRRQKVGLADYIYLSNELHLYNVRLNLNNYYALDNDINLNNFSNWDAIPKFEKGYVFNGQDYAINGMNIVVPQSGKTNYGFIAVNYGLISNLKIASFVINDTSSDTSGDFYFGSIAAVNNGSIMFCKASGKIMADRRVGVVGGLVGINYFNIHVNEFGYIGNAEQNVLFNSGDVGGIAGRNMGGDIRNCTTKNTYIGCYVNKCGNSFGGIVGYDAGGVISSCTADTVTMDIRNTTLVSGYYPKMGFIAGYLAENVTMSNCTVKNCTYYHGKLTVGYRKYCYNGTNGCYGLLESGTVN